LSFVKGFRQKRINNL